VSALLSVTGLGLRYGRRQWALRDCSLTVDAGSVVALIGPNGSGKTTLLNLAAGLLTPTAGVVELDGAPPGERLARIGYVAQDAPLWPRLRVIDALEVGTCMNPRFDRQLARRRIDDLDIPMRARIGTLSGGQRAQVALTLVLAKRPDLLLLDEPLANLDPLARRDFLTSMLGSCAEAGVAVIFSSHVVTELERICDHLVVLQNGRIKIAGDIDQLRTEHRVVSGPAGWPEQSPLSVVSVTTIGPRSVALVRGGSDVVLGPGFDEAQPTFDELALGYLATPAPRPERVPA
jgi:ABC-2 type transport system ATP-binding protein